MKKLILPILLIFILLTACGKEIEKPKEPNPPDKIETFIKSNICFGETSDSIFFVEFDGKNRYSVHEVLKTNIEITEKIFQLEPNFSISDIMVVDSLIYFTKSDLSSVPIDLDIDTGVTSCVYNMKTKNITEISKDFTAYGYYNNYLYGIKTSEFGKENRDGKSEIIRINLENLSEEALTTIDYGISFAINENYIFYSEDSAKTSDTPAIYRMNLDGSGKVKIKNLVANNIDIFDEMNIYYTEDNLHGKPTKLYINNFDGTNEKELDAKIDFNEVQFENEYFYYVNDSKLFRYKEKQEEVITSDIEHFFVSNDLVIYKERVINKDNTETMVTKIYDMEQKHFGYDNLNATPNFYAYNNFIYYSEFKGDSNETKIYKVSGNDLENSEIILELSKYTSVTSIIAKNDLLFFTVHHLDNVPMPNNEKPYSTIYVYNEKTKELTTLLTNHEIIGIVDNFLYSCFFKPQEAEEIVVLDINTLKIERNIPLKTQGTSFFLTNDKIFYYSNLSEIKENNVSGLYKMNLNGGENIKIISDNVYNLKAYKEKIYYKNKADKLLYSSDFAGENKELTSDSEFYFDFLIFDDYIYYYSSNASSYSLSRKSIHDTSTDKLLEQESSIYNLLRANKFLIFQEITKGENVDFPIISTKYYDLNSKKVKTLFEYQDKP